MPALTSSGDHMKDTLISAWLTWLAGGNTAESTLRVRRYALHAFARRYDLESATTEDVQDYLASLPGGPWSRSSHLSALRGFYRWGCLSGVLPHDPTQLVHGIRVPAGEPRPVPEVVLQRAIAVADDGVRLMLLLGAYEGLRRAEIAAFHSSCVTDTHLVICGKGSRTRLIPVHPRVRPMLGFRGYAFPSHRIPGAPVCPDTIGAMAKAALGQPYTCHTLRHRYATALYAACHDIVVCQRCLGHSNVATTMRYVGMGRDADVTAVLAVA